MNYSLAKPRPEAENGAAAFAAAKRLWPLLRGEHGRLAAAFLAIVANALLTLSGPLIFARAVDTYVAEGDAAGLARACALLLAIFLTAWVMHFLQTRLMGGVGQRLLERLRNAVFGKLLELPVAFFNQNKAGDLISRINNDTDKLNQFFSQSLMQIVGSLFTMLGAAAFLLALHPRLGAAALAPALVLLMFTRALSPWVKRKNTESLRAVGALSGELQESLDTFKVIVAFNRRDFFRRRFAEANEAAYRASTWSGYANNAFTPVYALCANLAQLAVLAYGIVLVSRGEATIGLLIGFLSYATTFYNPLRQMAALWASFQSAMAGWDRVSDVLALSSNLPRIASEGASEPDAPLLEFRDVRFTYADGTDVLRDVNFALAPGKTYALVGPTGGGKTTTASLMARLYDPTEGTVLLSGRDIRSYAPEERARKIGFILQDPFLFSGTLRENVLYGNERYAGLDDAALEAVLKEKNLSALLARFDEGLRTPITGGTDAISLGQKQLVAFVRAVLREPELLILDEATANVDTVTEQLLEDILAHLPPTTAKVVIAHRLNTIENADEIFFVNGGEVARAGSLERAVEMLMRGPRAH